MNLRRLAVGAVLALAVLGTTAHAQTNLSGPTVALDRYELAPGDRVQLTLAGFSSPVVSMAFCGNEARRGTVDCNVRGTQAREINSDGSPTLAIMNVSAPPAPCPCIVRVASRDNVEVAVVPFVLIGHPVAEVIGGTEFQTPLVVDVVANATPQGLGGQLRSSLGGSRTYDVTVAVTNQATFAIDDVAVAATFTRQNYDDTRTIELSDPGPMQPGETWRETVEVVVPSLTFGDVTWSATASGQGPAVTVSDTTTSTPWLLIVLGIVLLVDLLVLAARFVMRLRRRSIDDESESDEEADVVDAFEGGYVDEFDPSRGSPQPVG
jgi:hypothetical protein